MRPLALHIGPYGDVLRTSGRFLGTSSGRPRDVILPTGIAVGIIAVVFLIHNLKR